MRAEELDSLTEEQLIARANAARLHDASPGSSAARCHGFAPYVHVSQSHRPEFGTVCERLERVAQKLNERHARDVEENEARFSWLFSLDEAEQEKERARYYTRRATLKLTEDWPRKAFQLVEDHYPHPHEDRQGWDMGQCAHRIGATDREDSVHVRQFFYAVERIGKELFPENIARAGEEQNSNGSRSSNVPE